MVSGVSHEGLALSVHPGSRRVSLMLVEQMVCHGVLRPCQSLYIKGGRSRHCGLEAVGGIVIGDGSRRRDRYAIAMITLQVIARCNLKENKPSSWIASPPNSLTPLQVVT